MVFQSIDHGSVLVVHPKLILLVVPSLLPLVISVIHLSVRKHYEVGIFLR